MSKVSGAASPSESAGATTEQGQAVLRCAERRGGVNLDYSSDFNPLPGPCHRVLNDYNVKETALLPRKGLILRRQASFNGQSSDLEDFGRPPKPSPETIRSSP